jgi:large subunit ribosomal protein L3
MRLQRPAPFSRGLAQRGGRVSRCQTVRVEARQFRKALGVLGTKAGMVSFFTADGLCVPATVIALEEGNVVTQVKSDASDGYNAVQVGYKAVPQRKITKPELGHLQKAGVAPMKHLVEFKVGRQPQVHAAELQQPPFPSHTPRQPHVLYIRS